MHQLNGHMVKKDAYNVFVYQTQNIIMVYKCSVEHGGLCPV